MQPREFSPGFRLSVVDAVVLMAGAIGAVWLGELHELLWLGILIVVGHFFLFCNVFRLPRWLEFTWVPAFAAWAAFVYRDKESSLLPATIMLAIFSVGVIAWGMMLPSYHGVGWRYVNPELRGWWERERSTLNTQRDITSCMAMACRSRRSVNPLLVHSQLTGPR